MLDRPSLEKALPFTNTLLNIFIITEPGELWPPEAWYDSPKLLEKTFMGKKSGAKRPNHTSTSWYPDENLVYSTMEELSEGIQIVDHEWRYLYLNKAACIHGKKEKEELLGRRMPEAYPGIDQTKVFDFLKNRFKGKGPEYMLNDFVYPDIQQHGWFELRAYPVDAGLLIHSIDVTEKKEIEARYLHSQKMEAIGRLAGGVAHDFNNNLAVITLCLDLLQEQTLGDEGTQNHLRRIALAADRSRALTRQLLAFSRKQILRPQTVDLNEAVKESLELFERINGGGIQVKLCPGKLSRGIHVDVSQLDQVIMNLLVNAKDAMPDGGEITVETAEVSLDEDYVKFHPESQAGPHIMLAITDTGRGMDKASQKRIFEPFFTTKKIGHGTGLGLATVHGIVKQSGGNIWVYSEVGRGTTFKVYFPRLDNWTEAKGNKADPWQDLRGEGVIVVVDDDPLILEVLEEILKLNGYQVHPMPSAEAALRFCKNTKEHIDILLTDVIMPETSGIQLSEEIKTILPDVSVVLMSGYTKNTVGIENDTNLLQKPINYKELLSMLRNVTKRAKQD